MRKLKNTIMAFGMLAYAAGANSQAAISITIASPNTTAGLIYDSTAALVTQGFARVGKITGSIDLTKGEVNWSNYSYWNSIFTDVNSSAGGGGSTPSTWNFNSSGALTGSSTGVSTSVFAQNTPLYIWAFKIGKSLTAGSAGSNGIPSLLETDFTSGGVEWALLAADEWKAPADLGAVSLVINQATATDTRVSPIIGSDLGASVTMVPEPSTGALMMIGACGLVALRRFRKV
jgi:hypothetical protein